MMKRVLLVLAILFGCSSFAHAEDVLFLGNSFTSANSIPSMVAAVAESKGKKAATTAITKGGQDFAYHLKHSLSRPEATAKPWSFVVLQDQSQAATHVRKVDDFFRNGEALADRVAEKSPTGKIVLYETWAYAADHACYKASDKGPAQFADPDQMLGEIQKNYAALQSRLQAKHKDRQVLLAPVGTAFARCVREHPEINLYSDDRKHPSLAGSYLSALVIYSVLFNDSPLGAAPGRKVDPKIVKILQDMAEQAVRDHREARAFNQERDANVAVYYETADELCVGKPAREEPFTSEQALLQYLTERKQSKELLVVVLGKRHAWSDPKQSLDGFWQACKQTGFERVVIQRASAFDRAILRE